MSRTTEEKLDILAIVLHKMVNNESLTIGEANMLNDVEYLARKNLEKYQEERRAMNKILQLQTQLETLFEDYPHLKCHLKP